MSEKPAGGKTTTQLLCDISGQLGTLNGVVSTLDGSVQRLDANVTALDAEVKNHNTRLVLEKQEREAAHKADLAQRAAEHELLRRERAVMVSQCEERHKRISEQFKRLGCKDQEIEHKLEETGKMNLVELSKAAGRKEFLEKVKAYGIEIGKILLWAFTVSSIIIGAIVSLSKLGII